jgi:hypothetical protein
MSRFDRMTRFIDTARARAVLHIAIVLGMYLAVAALSTAAFMQRWGLGEEYSALNIERLIDGTAPKPWAYRVLAPSAIKFIQDHVPDDQEAKIGRALESAGGLGDRFFKADGKLQWSDRFSFVYHLGYGVMFASYFLFLLILRALLQQVYPAHRALADVFPLVCGLIIPTAYLRGGYIYDFPELMFMALCFLLAVRRWYWALAIALVLAVLNKESNVILPLILAPIIAAGHSKARSAALVVTLLAVVAVPFLWVRVHFADNDGTGLILQARQNLQFWLSPSPWFGFTTLFAPLVLFPKPPNIAFMAVLVALVLSRSIERPTWVQQSTLIAFALNLPLLFFFGFKDEIRNLSLTFVPLAVFVAAAIPVLYDRGERSDPKQ